MGVNAIIATASGDALGNVGSDAERFVEVGEQLAGSSFWFNDHFAPTIGKTATFSYCHLTEGRLL
jgi:hypothetical protein